MGNRSETVVHEQLFEVRRNDYLARVWVDVREIGSWTKKHDHECLDAIQTALIKASPSDTDFEIAGSIERSLKRGGYETAAVQVQSTLYDTRVSSLLYPKWP